MDDLLSYEVAEGKKKEAHSLVFTIPATRLHDCTRCTYDVFPSPRALMTAPHIFTSFLSRSPRALPSDSLSLSFQKLVNCIIIYANNSLKTDARAFAAA